MRAGLLEEVAPFGGLPVAPGVRTVGLDLPIGRLTASLIDPPDARATALLVPGFTGGKEDFRELLPLLGDRGIRTLAYSRRGQADSAAPDALGEYALDREAGDVAWIAGLLGGPVHLLGHSLGGVIARAAAIARPELFASVTLFCSGPRGWRNRTLAPRVLAETEGTEAVWAAGAPWQAAARESELSAEDLYYRERMRRTSPLSIIAGARILEDPTDRTAELAATGLRMLVAHGEADEAWPIPWQRDEATALGARYEVIPDAAHSPNLENPIATADLLADFWTSR